jgi:hypothetical protein
VTAAEMNAMCTPLLALLGDGWSMTPAGVIRGPRPCVLARLLAPRYMWSGTLVAQPASGRKAAYIGFTLSPLSTDPALKAASGDWLLKDYTTDELVPLIAAALLAAAKEC